MDKHLENEINALLGDLGVSITYDFFDYVVEDDKLVKKVVHSNSDQVLVISYMGEDAICVFNDDELVLLFAEGSIKGGFLELWAKPFSRPDSVVIVNSNNREKLSSDTETKKESFTMYPMDAEDRVEPTEIVYCDGVSISLSSGIFFDITPNYMMGGFVLSPSLPDTEIAISCYDDTFCVEQIEC